MNDAQARQLLHEFLRQPSVAAQNLGMEEMAQRTARALSALGARVEVWPTPRHPVVFAAIDRGRPRTVCFYNHYDVQPPEPLDAWDSPPFDPTERDGRLYARGVADNKGNLVARIAAVAAMLESSEGLPVNVKFIVEGGEEIGSPHLDDVVRDHAAALAGDGLMWESGYRDPAGRPTISLGLKGNLYVEITIDEERPDIHSSFAPLAANPAWKLAWLLGEIKRPDGTVAVPGLTNAVRPLSAEDAALLDAMPFDDAARKKALGVSRFLDDVGGFEAKRRLFFEPTCNIAGLVAGYTGQGAKTIVPGRASAKMDLRLVPDQHPDEVLRTLRAFVAERCPGAQVHVHSASRPSRSSPNSAIARAVIATAQEVYGLAPLVLPMTAGSGPMQIFKERLGVPIVATGVGDARSNRHAPNESIASEDFPIAIRHVVAALRMFAALPGEDAAAGTGTGRNE